MDAPQISVITVCYNSAATIEATLESVASQTCKNFEHIVVDGGSTDGTLAIIEKHRDKLAIIVSEPDQGIYDAMNKGIKVATGEIIGFLNSDDLFADETVLDQVASVFQDPSIDACYADLIYVDQVAASKVVRYWKSKPFRNGLFAEGWCPPHPTFYVRKPVYESCGRFNLEYRLAADAELMMRFLKVNKIRSVYIPHIWVKMRIGGATNKSVRNIFFQNVEIVRAAKANGISLNPMFFLLRKLTNRFQQFHSKSRK